MNISLRKVKMFGRFPFVRLQQIIDNPAYLIHILKKNIFYKRENVDFSSQYTGFLFLDGSESLEYIINNRASLARFSDGEIGVIHGASICPPDSDWSQRWSHSLARDLVAVLKSSRPNLLIAVDPPKVFLAKKNSEHPIPFCWNMWVDTRRSLYKYLNKQQSYGHCHLFLQANAPEFCWEKFRHYLEDRFVIVCSGDVNGLKHLRIGRSTYFLECGKDNAYEKIDAIEESIRSTIEDKKIPVAQALVMLCLGPTACILAYRMSDLQVLDTGHIFEFAEPGFIEKKLSSAS